MLIRICLDGGRSWHSLYFSDVSEQQANKIRSAFRFSSLPQCWRNVVVSEKDNILEIKANFSVRVRFDCLKNLGDNREQWRKKACRMNRDNLIASEGKIRAIEESIIQSKIQCCAQNLKAGKCKNPFVVENLGRVLLPHLYPNAKQK